MSPSSAHAPPARRGRLVAVVAATLALASPDAEAIPIQIRGAARIEGVAIVGSTGTRIRGELTDEAGQPVPAATVTIEILSGDPSRAPLPLAAATSCGTDAAAVRATSTTYSVITDARGELCVATGATPPGGVIAITFAGGKLHDAARTEVPIEDASAATVTRTRIEFDARAEAIDLDEETAAIGLELQIERSDARFARDAPARREGLTVLLEDERGARLGSATTAGDGSARFEVATATLGDPGLGELRAKFEGSAELARASAALPIVRRAAVEIALARAIEPGDPEHGVPVDLEVRSARGVVDGGVLEAVRDGESVGAGSVEAGAARVVVTFAGGRDRSATLTMRYVPAAPFWSPGSELAVDLPLKGPSPARDVALACAVAALAAWIVAGWRRAPKPRMQKDDGATMGPPSGRPGVLIVRPSTAAHGWTGFVHDAHDGAPIAGAELRIVQPSFEGDGVAAITRTDDRGAFELHATHRGDARLVVTADTHSAYEQALPPPSVLGVALVTRRRALLERLVHWAKQTGAPFDGSPEPTPGHVRRAASRANATEVAGWAQEVEHAVYGPEHVDADAEERVRASEPRRKRPL